MRISLAQRLEIVQAVCVGKLNKRQAAQLLGCTTRTIDNYCQRYSTQGEVGLKDGRHSNFFKLTAKDRERIIALKTADRWRSARNIVDKLQLGVSEATVWRICKQANLARQNVQRVKALQRFEAQYPNDLWQTDIMGRIDFPRLGSLYLIATIDDHSRFCLAGKWFGSQNKINVFVVWYEALSHWGCPKAILQDQGSQYKARARFGVADYQWYAHALGIKLLWARRAQPKGKVERFWKFVQTDFVREVWNATSLEEVNRAFARWLVRYNYHFKSRYFGRQTRASRYSPSSRRIDQVTLRSVLAIQEQRKVTRQSTISLYGRQYLVPSAFIGRRIWIKIIGNKLLFEGEGRVIWKTEMMDYNFLLFRNHDPHHQIWQEAWQSSWNKQENPEQANNGDIDPEVVG